MPTYAVAWYTTSLATIGLTPPFSAAVAIARNSVCPPTAMIAPSWTVSRSTRESDVRASTSSNAKSW